MTQERRSASRSGRRDRPRSRVESTRFLLRLALCLILAALGCGREKSLSLIARDADDRPMARVRVVDAESGAVLGTTDANGTLVLTRPPEKGSRYRLRCEPPSGLSEPWEFDAPLTITRNDFEMGQKVVRARLAALPEEGEEALASLVVNTDPPGATVYIDGRAVGRTPMTVEELDPGFVDLELRLEGYHDHAKQLLLPAGEQTYQCALTADAKSAPAPEPRSVPPSGGGREPSFSDRDPAGTSTSPDPGRAPSQEPPPNQPRETPAVREPARGDDAESIRAVVAAYARALQALDIDQYGRLFAALPDGDRKSLKNSFSDIRSQRVEVSDIKVTVDGARATAQFHEARTVSFKAGRDHPFQSEVSMQLERATDGAWRIRSLKR